MTLGTPFKWILGDNVNFVNLWIPESGSQEDEDGSVVDEEAAGDVLVLFWRLEVNDASLHSSCKYRGYTLMSSREAQAYKPCIKKAKISNQKNKIYISPFLLCQYKYLMKSKNNINIPA